MLELNASDERGISVVRTKIKAFASVAVGPGVPGFPCPPYKLLILDEADAMTEDAQNALRRTMEAYSRVTRFCFICNYVSRIIDPIVSRCAKFRFKPVAAAAAEARIHTICASEGLRLEPGAMDALAACSGGDMRKAITLLQCAARLGGASVSASSVAEAAGAVPPAVVAPLLAALRPSSGATFDALAAAVKHLVKEGYPALAILHQLADDVFNDAAISDDAKATVAARLGAADKALADGADEGLQLLDCCAAAQRALCGLPPVGRHVEYR